MTSGLASFDRRGTGSRTKSRFEIRRGTDSSRFRDFNCPLSCAWLRRQGSIRCHPSSVCPSERRLSSRFVLNGYRLEKALTAMTIRQPIKITSQLFFPRRPPLLPPSLLGLRSPFRPPVRPPRPRPLPPPRPLAGDATRS